MRYSKGDIKLFFIWLRNGIAFCVTWLLILGILICLINGIEYVPLSALNKMFLFACGGVLIFCIWFSPLPFKKIRFMGRLSGFFASFALYELVSFFLSGLFTLSETTLPLMAAFIGIMLVLYIMCILIDKYVYAKQDVIYTEKLREYQRKREGE